MTRHINTSHYKLLNNTFSKTNVPQSVQDQLTQHDLAIKNLQASNKEIKQTLEKTNNELSEYKVLSKKVLDKLDILIDGSATLPSSSPVMEQLECSTTTTSTTTTTSSTTTAKTNTETVTVSTAKIYTFGKPPMPRRQNAVKSAALQITDAQQPKEASTIRPLSLRRKIHKPADIKEDETATTQKKTISRRKPIIEDTIVIKDSDDENDNSLPVLTKITQSSPDMPKKRKRIFVETQEPEPKRSKIVPRNVTKNQQLRDNFTSAVMTIPTWLPYSFCALTYLVVKFYWVHEECVYQLKTIHQNERGQRNSSYRNKFHDIGHKAAQFFDQEAKTKLDNDKLATIVSILPWYKKHQPQWSRPNIHPNTSHNSIRKFKFKTRTDFIENFLAQIGGKYLHLI